MFKLAATPTPRIARFRLILPASPLPLSNYGFCWLQLISSTTTIHSYKAKNSYLFFPRMQRRLFGSPGFDSFDSPGVAIAIIKLRFSLITTYIINSNTSFTQREKFIFIFSYHATVTNSQQIRRDVTLILDWLTAVSRSVCRQNYFISHYRLSQEKQPNRAVYRMDIKYLIIWIWGEGPGTTD